MLSGFFFPESVVLIGASRTPGKVGHIILRNFIDGGFKGRLFLVNNDAEEVLGRKAYKSVRDIDENVGLAIIAVPARHVIKAAEDCGKKGIKNIIIISSGFKEVGNASLENKLANVIKKYRMKCIGPNCLGIFDAHSGLDSLFLPRYRLRRPEGGSLAFVCQSGAVGAAVLDYATENGYGFSKFISYGNAVDVNETDLLEFLMKDTNTKVICMYIEGVKDGRRFLQTLRNVTNSKPVIIIKGGKTDAGKNAAMSHTGTLAGSAEIYSGAFRQANAIEADTLEELFEFAKILESCKNPKGNRIQIITNGGGYGILSTDAAVKYGLAMAVPEKKSVAEIRKTGITTQNPIDLLGDANDSLYKKSLEIAMKDKHVDIIFLIILYQTPLITTNIVDVVIEARDSGNKPIVVVSTGGEFTELLTKELEKNRIPTYSFPDNAAKSIKKLTEYYSNK